MCGFLSKKKVAAALLFATKAKNEPLALGLRALILLSVHLRNLSTLLCSSLLLIFLTVDIPRYLLLLPREVTTTSVHWHLLSKAGVNNKDAFTSRHLLG